MKLTCYMCGKENPETSATTIYETKEAVCFECYYQLDEDSDGEL